MGYFERLVDRSGSTGPARPKAPVVAGGPPKPSMPTPFKNPPGVAEGPVGRPASPAPPFGGSTGSALPVSPQAARPATPGAAPSSGPAPRPAAAARPQDAATPTTPVPGTTPAAPALTMTFDRYPSPFDLSQLPPGVNAMTPYGPIDRSGSVTFTPEGELKYKADVVKRRKDFGPHPWAGDASAPQPPARMGKWVFNPFTGQWRQ